MKHPSDLVLEDVAHRLRILRYALNRETQVAMVKFLGPPITSQHWNNWERARQVPDLPQARRIALRTGITVDWLYWGNTAGLPLNLAARLQEVEAEANRA